MLNWKTYGALPVLKSYQEALAHFNNVVPIRGDVDGTKPVGRRDQKWLSIYKRDTDNAICVGSRWNKDKALLAYYPDGRVGIEQQIGASCRERIQRIAGLRIRRRDNEDWVQAVSYVDGKAVEGKYPLKLHYNNPRKAFFILHGDSLPTYLNPVPVYKHTINKQANAEITARYKPFLAYVEAMSKLSADQVSDNPQIPALTFDERKAMNLPTAYLNWHYGTSDDAVTHLIKMLDSGDTGEWYKAMVWISGGYWRMHLSDFKNGLKNLTQRHHKDALFIKVRADAGTYVYDRYGRYFR